MKAFLLACIVLLAATASQACDQGFGAFRGQCVGGQAFYGPQQFNGGGYYSQQLGGGCGQQFYGGGQQFNGGGYYGQQQFFGPGRQFRQVQQVRYVPVRQRRFRAIGGGGGSVNLGLINIGNF